MYPLKKKLLDFRCLSHLLKIRTFIFNIASFSSLMFFSLKSSSSLKTKQQIFINIESTAGITFIATSTCKFQLVILEEFHFKVIPLLQNKNKQFQNEQLSHEMPGDFVGALKIQHLKNAHKK